MDNDAKPNENVTEPQATTAPSTDSNNPSPAGTAKTNTLAIVAIITTFLFPFVGLILGIIALKQIKQTKEEGRGLALAAVILSSIWVALIVLAVIMLAIFGFAAERVANNAGVKVDTKNEKVTVKDGNGSTQVGDNVSLPSGFPSSMPIYPGANIYTASKNNGTDYYVAATTSDSFDKVNSYYKAQLVSNGWTIESSSDISESDGGKGTYIKASTSELIGTISIQTGSDSKTVITITVNPR
jgi:hypothetical protein